MAPSAKSVITLRDVGVRDGSVHLDSITFDVPQSSCFALLALPNTGKTIVIKTLAGLTVLDSGSGHILDYPLQDPRITRDQRIGFSHQSVNWSASLTVSEILRLVVKQYQETMTDSDVDALIELAGLQAQRHLTSDQLSTQKRQLVSLLALHIRNPDILILDDPTDRLGEEERQAILDLLRHMGRGRTVFFTSSHLSDVQQLATHVAVLHQGTILARGETKPTLEHPDAAHFRVLLLGDAHLVYEQLRTLAWVSEITQTIDGQHTEWLIWLREGRDTPSNLLRAILADQQLQVVEFTQVRPRLDQFMMALTQATAE